MKQKRPVDFDEAASRPSDYAPPATRATETTLEQISKLTRDFDALIASAEAEVQDLKREVEAVRDEYVRHTTRVAEDVKKLQETVRLGMDAMKALHSHCSVLDARQHGLSAVEAAIKTIEN